ncbi:MAG: hypothetical protein IPI55_17260 [Flavobacteriales bacterium]|nr:hypothetical protein [Flavobacteriales bacterium]
MLFTTPALDPTNVFFEAVFSGPAFAPSMVLSTPHGVPLASVRAQAHVGSPRGVRDYPVLLPTYTLLPAVVFQ